MGDLIHMRDFKTREEREAEIGRFGPAIVNEALLPDDDDDLPKWPDSGDCA